MDNRIAKRFDKIPDKEAIITFFKLLNQLIQELGINADDPRFSTNVRNDNRKRISVCINGLLALSLKEDPMKPRIQFLIHKDKFDLFEKFVIQSHDFEANEGRYTLIDVHYDIDNDDRNNLVREWIDACRGYLPAQERSQYRKSHIPELYQMASDQNLLNEYIENDIY